MAIAVDPFKRALPSGSGALTYYATTTNFDSAGPTSLVVAPSQSAPIIVNAATTTTVAAATTTALNATESQFVSAEVTAQLDLDLAMPRNVYICLAIFMVLAMILAHPRFLARLLASFPSQRFFYRRRAYDKDGAFTRLDPKSERRVGGGDLRYGWFLRSKSASSWSSPTSPNTRQAAPSATLMPPPYVAPLLSHLPFHNVLYYAPFSNWPRFMRMNATLIPLYLILAYCLLMGFGLFWDIDISPSQTGSGWGYEFQRFAFLGTSQIPLTVALGVRGNLLGLCVGQGYERLKLLHKVVGMAAFLGSSLHVIAFLVMWHGQGTVASESTQGWVIWGYLAWGGMIVLMLTSIPAFRQRLYNCFKMCHIVGMVLLIVGLAVHVKIAIPWCVAAAGFYVISQILTLTKTRLAHAEIMALPGSDTVMITVPRLTSGWRPGQHVRLRIPALGGFAALEAHPFTIASGPDIVDEDSDEPARGLVLMIKKAGDWTTKLYDFAKAAESTSEPADRLRHEREYEVDLEGKAVVSSGEMRTATVVIEGPYGGLGDTMPAAFSSVLLVAGGSGLSLPLSMAEDLVSRAPTGCVRPRLVEVVWLVKNEESARETVQRKLAPLVRKARRNEEAAIRGQREGRDVANPVALRVTVYLTRCPSSSPITLVPPDLDFDLVSSPSKSKSVPTEAQAEKNAYLSRNPSNASTLSFASTSSTSSYTSNTSSSPLKKTSAGSSGRHAMSSIQASPMRPHMPTLVETVVDSTLERHLRSGASGKSQPKGVCVAVCGPEQLVVGVRKAVAGLDDIRTRAVGGVVLEEELFAF